MKREEVELGAGYLATVNGIQCAVRVEEESPFGGWIALNLTNRKRIWIRSAARLKRPSEIENNSVGA